MFNITKVINKIKENNRESIRQLTYLGDDGNICPFCKSNNLRQIEATVEFEDNGTVSAGVHCCSCNKDWVDVFQLIKFYVK